MQTGAAVLAHRPELALLVMQIIAAWSHTENALGRFLAACMHAESSAGLKMYLSLSGGEARRAVLEAAASTSLDADDLARFRLVMRAIKPMRDRRNEFAHGIWSMSPDLPDALIWRSSDRDVGEHDGLLRRDPPPDRGLMVYRAKDLQDDLGNAIEASSAASCLWLSVDPGFEDARVGAMERLQSLNIIARQSTVRLS